MNRLPCSVRWKCLPPHCLSSTTRSLAWSFRAAKMMQVQVPPGVVGGQIMTVQSGAQLVQVQVPPGLVAGQSFQIKAPEPQVAMMQVQVPAGVLPGHRAGSRARPLVRDPLAGWPWPPWPPWPPLEKTLKKTSELGVRWLTPTHPSSRIFFESHRGVAMVAMVAIDGRTRIASSRRPTRGSGVVRRVPPRPPAWNPRVLGRLPRGPRPCRPSGRPG